MILRAFGSMSQQACSILNDAGLEVDRKGTGQQPDAILFNVDARCSPNRVPEGVLAVVKLGAGYPPAFLRDMSDRGVVCFQVPHRDDLVNTDEQAACMAAELIINFLRDGTIQHAQNMRDVVLPRTARVRVVVTFSRKIGEISRIVDTILVGGTEILGCIVVVHHNISYAIFDVRFNGLKMPPSTEEQEKAKLAEELFGSGPWHLRNSMPKGVLSVRMI